jgi:hypothetical protein
MGTATADRPKSHHQKWREENPDQAEAYDAKRKQITMDVHQYSEAGRLALEKPQGWQMVMTYAARHWYVTGTVNTMALAVYLAQQEYAAKQAGVEYAPPTDLRSFQQWKAVGRMIPLAGRPEQPDGLGWRPNSRRVTVEENGQVVTKQQFMGKFSGYEMWDVSRTVPFGKKGAENPDAPVREDRTRRAADVARVLAEKLGEKVKAKPTAADAIRLLEKAAGGEVEAPEPEDDGDEIEFDEDLDAQIGGSIAYVAGLILGLPVKSCPWPAGLAGLQAGPRESALSMVGRQVMMAGRAMAARIADLVDKSAK